MNYFTANPSFCIWSIIFICIFIIPNTDAYAAKLHFSSSVGYSSNPDLQSESLESNTFGSELLESKLDKNSNSEDSFFSLHTLSLEQQFTVAEKFAIDITPSVTYQNFCEVPDNNQFNFELSISPTTSAKRVIPYFFTNTFLYRDSMLKLDNRDEFTLGVGGEIMLSSRYTLAFEHSWQRINYLEDSPLFVNAGREIRIEPVNRLIDNLKVKVKETYNERDDVNMILKTRLDIFLLPSVTTSFGLKYDYLVSTLDAESFWQLTPDIKVIWDFTNKWQLVTSAQVERINFFNIKEVVQQNYTGIAIISNITKNDNILNIRDINYITSLNLRLSYFLSNIQLINNCSMIKNNTDNNIELFADFFTEHGEYPLNSQSYNQQVLQCGFSWSF